MNNFNILFINILARKLLGDCQNMEKNFFAWQAFCQNMEITKDGKFGELWEIFCSPKI